MSKAGSGRPAVGVLPLRDNVGVELMPSRTAERLNLSQSALSVQIRKLEERLGHALFERRGRQLLLTEAGRITLDHADSIFAVGDELIGTLRQTGRASASATWVRNASRKASRSPA